MTMRTRSAPRGFLLVDTMIAGAIAAVVIAGVLSVLANARARNVAAARDVVASQLVLERLDQIRSLPFASIASEAAAPVSGVTGSYTRSATVSNTGSPETVGSFSLAFVDVTVTVTYRTTAAFDSKIRTSQATSRVYR